MGQSCYFGCTVRAVAVQLGCYIPLQWRHNKHDGVSNHRYHDCLINRLLRRRSKETSKLRVTGLWEGNSPVTGEFPAQRASNAETVSIWWRHHISFGPLTHATVSPHSMFYTGSLAKLTLNVNHDLGKLGLISSYKINAMSALFSINQWSQWT